MTESLRWKKMKKRESSGPESLLRGREDWCVAACGRYLRRNPSKDPVWTLRDKNSGVQALILQSKRTLLPVFSGQKNIPPPRFLSGFFNTIPVHSLQGMKDDAVLLEQALEKMGRRASENIDYDLMSIDRYPNAECFSSGPAGLILRKPLFTDMDALAALQAGYEQEEVLPKNAVFYPAASRMNAEHMLSDAQVLVAEYGGQLVGKINTSAVSFTRIQVGGVYVHPGFRGLGIAHRMIAEFVRDIVAQGRGVTLFVKKSNAAARAVYQRLGFAIMGDYRISYY
jgi:ribosomal protein S18 acetylase RimI-like enzyme